MVKSLPANAGDIRDGSLIPGSRRFPGRGHGTHSSILAWRILWTEEPGRLQLHPTIYKTRRRQWHPTPVLLPGKSHGRRSLVSCSPWGRWGLDTTERLHFHFSLSRIGEGNGNHSSVLAWRIPGTGKPGGLPSMGSHRVGHDWSDLAIAIYKTANKVLLSGRGNYTQYVVDCSVPRTGTTL